MASSTAVLRTFTWISRIFRPSTSSASVDGVTRSLGPTRTPRLSSSEATSTALVMTSLVLPSTVTRTETASRNTMVSPCSTVAPRDGSTYAPRPAVTLIRSRTSATVTSPATHITRRSPSSTSVICLASRTRTSIPSVTGARGEGATRSWAPTSMPASERISATRESNVRTSVGSPSTTSVTRFSNWKYMAPPATRPRTSTATKRPPTGLPPARGLARPGSGGEARALGRARCLPGKSRGTLSKPQPQVQS